MTTNASVTIPVQPSGPSLEEQAAQQAAAAEAPQDASLPSDGDTTERPEWLPEKFESPEALAAAYAEMEKKQSQGQPTEGGDDQQQAAEGAVEAAGLDMDALSAEYSEKGELTTESLEALAKVGISADMVQAYAAGQEALQAQAIETLLAPVGGEEGYNTVIGWAADNLPEAEIDTFNSIIEGGDQAAMKMAVENLNAKYVAANGSEPKVSLQGSKAQSSSTDVYTSTAQMQADMADPRYTTDPAFRDKVAAKLGRSNII